MTSSTSLRPSTVSAASFRSRFAVALSLSWLLVGCVDDHVQFSEGPAFGGTSSAAGAASSGDGSGASSSSGADTAGSGGASGAGSNAGSAPIAGSAPGGSSSGGNAGNPSGGSGVGGMAGAAGAPPIGAPQKVLDLIDDVESGFPSLPARGGRNGAWYLVHDDSLGTATDPFAQLLAPPRGESLHAAAVSGVGFNIWGIELGVSLRSPVAAYDATQYCGVSFFARGSGGAWRLLIGDRASEPAGGVCDPASADPTRQCYDHLGTSFTPASAWQKFEVPFATLAPVQGYSGRTSPLDTAGLFDILFSFHDQAGAAFTLDIDDLAFIVKPAEGCR
jgi:hypothetical protein